MRWCPTTLPVSLSRRSEHCSLLTSALVLPVPDVSDDRNDYEGRSQLLMMWI